MTVYAFKITIKSCIHQSLRGSTKRDILRFALIYTISISVMNVVPIRALNTNYIWTIITDQVATVVDPGEASQVIQYLADHGLTCTNIIITHHHPDHTGGVKALLEHFPNTPVYGPDLTHLGLETIDVSKEDNIKIKGFTKPWQIIPTPGHTLDHLCFYNPGYLFCGDTLFSAGCGRIFEGTPEQMFHSLNLIKNLPPETLVYPGHEITLDNIDFAESIDNENPDLTHYKKETIKRLSQKQPSLPSTLDLELKVNPFLRTETPMIQNKISQQLSRNINTPLDTFIALRKLKDHF